MEGLAGFGCSPLSCNHMASRIETNEDCLLLTQSIAGQVAVRFSREEPEPAPYYVVEALRRSATARAPVRPTPAAPVDER